LVILYQKNIAKRIYAAIIDYGLIFLITWVYIMLFGKPDGKGAQVVSGFSALLIPIVWFIYFPVAEAFFGQTPGKASLHLIVTDEKGESAGLNQTLSRRITDIIELAFLGIPAVISINSTEKFQRLGDLFGKTRVLSTDSICSNCDTKVTMTRKEAFNKRFFCPECDYRNE
jgi:uncharacterized RDD family membrane protein YckC